MKGTGPYAEMIARRFHMAVKRLLNKINTQPIYKSKGESPPAVGGFVAS